MALAHLLRGVRWVVPYLKFGTLHAHRESAHVPNEADVEHYLELGLLTNLLRGVGWVVWYLKFATPGTIP